MARIPRILTLGAATLDVFLVGGVLAAKRDVRTHDYVAQFPLGAKLELDDVVFATGGGATNAAVTFARAGLKADFMGKIGGDLAGREIMADLKLESVNPRLVAIDQNGATGYSTLLLAPGGERTILVYRGVSEKLKKLDFKLKKIKADWLYITSLAGDLDLLESVVETALKRKIKVAMDPGSKELAHPTRFKKILPHLSLLKGNKEEMGHLFGQKTMSQIVRKGASFCPYFIVSDGPNGSVIAHQNSVYQAGLYKDVEVVDRTGAGDAFGSGFVAMIAQNKPIEEAITYASANSTSVVGYIGAKRGILKKGIKLDTMLIKAQALR
jgi:sugar/nucleoside kinase (ribokinase family)